MIPPAPEALPLPELPIPVFEEQPKQPFAAYGARKYMQMTFWINELNLMFVPFH